MRVVRERDETIDEERTTVDRLFDIAADGESALSVRQPPQQVTFGRRDTRCVGYERARQIARKQGFRPVERSTGGRAVAFDGRTTIAVIRADPIDDFRTGMEARYDRLLTGLQRVLRSIGVETVRQEPADSFCPGSHSLSVRDSTGSLRKIVGVAQRVRPSVAMTGAVILVDSPRELRAVLDPVYDALSIPFEPETLGTITCVRSRPDGTRLRQRLEETLAEDGQ